MTISSQTFRFTYISTGGATYPYTNKILTSSDLAVYVDEELKTLTTDYTVTGVGEASGGNVVFGTAPAEDAVVLITKDGVELTQETDYVENDAFPAAAHEDALDKLTNITQKIWDYVRRSIKVTITSTLTDLEFPVPEANKVLGWNGTATDFQNFTLAGTGAISDETYNSTTWNGVDTIAPSKNAIRDKIESFFTDSGLTASQTVFSDANKKLITKSAADTMAALVGSLTANYKCFVNAAGNGTEWAKGIKLGSFTRDAAAEAGDVSYDGVGFKPTILVFFSYFSATSQSDGISDVTNNYCLLRLSAPALSYSGTRCIYIANSAGTAHQDAVVKSMDSDGFTLTWAKTSTPTGTASIFYIAFR